MRIAFIVNRVEREDPATTTIVLAHCASRRGHRVHLMDVTDLACFPDGHVGGPARRAPELSPMDSTETYLAHLRSDDARDEISTRDLDVLWIRYNSSELGLEESWAMNSGFLFGQLAMQQGVLVLDHPESLLYADSKLYLLHFPASVRPRSLITRNVRDVRRFYEECGQRMVLKPLNGSCGVDVYLLDRDTTNLNGLFQSLARRGHVIAEEYLPEAANGDVRLFVMNGKPLIAEGRTAAIHRVNPPDDFRSNMTVGATAARAEVTPEMLAVAELVGPKLRQDGIFFAALDFVGNRILEITTTSPGGLWSASRLEGVDFAAEVIREVERKVEHRNSATGGISNRALASMV